MMFYVIVISVVLMALFLIFREDHDKSYNKNERSAPKPPKPQPQPPKPPQPPQHKPEPPSSVFPSIKQPAKDVVEDIAQEQIAQEEDEAAPHIDLSFLLSLDYDEDLEENTETFDIAGLRYHCTEKDCGPIVGYVKPEPSNVHDSRAQAVIRSDGKLLGYIPRTQLDDYEDFNEDDVVCPFVGEIMPDDSDWLYGEIKVIIPTSIEFVRDEIADGL